MTRTNIAVEDVVADSLSDEAAKENKTLYALANEALQAVLQVCREGGKPEDVYVSWFFTRVLRDLDSVPVPGDLLEKMVKALYAANSSALLSYWFDEGARIGAYLRLSSPKIEGLSSEVKELSKANLLPLKRIEVREEEGDKVAIRVVGAGPSAESTKCAEHLIRGLIGAYSYRVIESTATEGMIQVRASRQAEPTEA